MSRLARKWAREDDMLNPEGVESVPLESADASLSQIASDIDSAREYVDQADEVVGEADAVSKIIESKIDSGEAVENSEVELIKIQVESMQRRLGYAIPNFVTLSSERDNERALRLAGESAGSVVHSIWTKIKEFFTSMFAKVKLFFRSLFDSVLKLQNRAKKAVELSKKLTTIKDGKLEFKSEEIKNAFGGENFEFDVSAFSSLLQNYKIEMSRTITKSSTDIKDLDTAFKGLKARLDKMSDEDMKPGNDEFTKELETFRQEDRKHIKHDFLLKSLSGYDAEADMVLAVGPRGKVYRLIFKEEPGIGGETVGTSRVQVDTIVATSYSKAHDDEVSTLQVTQIRALANAVESLAGELVKLSDKSSAIDTMMQSIDRMLDTVANMRVDKLKEEKEGEHDLTTNIRGVVEQVRKTIMNQYELMKFDLVDLPKLAYEWANNILKYVELSIHNYDS